MKNIGIWWYSNYEKKFEGMMVNNSPNINKQITSHLNSLNTNKYHDLWRWKSRSWFRRSTKMWWDSMAETTMAETTMDEMVLWTKRLVPICITVLIPSHFCASPKSGPGFPTSYIVVFVCVQWVKVRGDLFVDIGGIVHHHCFKFKWVQDVSSIVPFRP
jgi:hypothetical protein